MNEVAIENRINEELRNERATNNPFLQEGLEKKSEGMDEEDQRWYRKKAEIPVSTEDNHKGGYILSKDINSRGVKSYTKFETYNRYITYLNNNKHGNLNEIIESTRDKVYMYMDIDRYLTENEGNITDEILTAVISTLQTFLNKRYKKSIEFIQGENIEISTASTDTKCSAHIRTDITFRSVEEHKIFTMGLVRYIIENGIEDLLYERNGKRECVVDGSVYTNFRSYRCLYMSKYGKQNYLMPYGGSSDKIEDHLVNYRPGITKEPIFELEITDTINIPRPITHSNRLQQITNDEMGTEEYNRIVNDKRIQTLLGLPRIQLGNIIEREGVGKVEVVNRPICPYANRVHRSNRLYIRYVRRQRKSYICCHDEECMDRQQYSFTYYDIEETMKGIVDGANITSLHSQQDNIIWDEKYTNETMNDLPKKNLVCVRAGMGTGKTKAMKRFIVNNCNRNDNVLVVTFSRNLAKKYTEELGGIGFVNYQTSEHYQISETKVIICLDSLRRVNMRRIDYIFIDEALSVFIHFNSPLMRETSAISTLLEYMIVNAKQVYMLDACMDNIFMYNVVEHFRKRKGIEGGYWIWNKYVRPTNRRVEMVVERGMRQIDDANDTSISYEAMNKVVQLLRDGKKVVVSSSTKKFTKQLEWIIKMTLPETKMMVYNSDTTKETGENPIIDTEEWSYLDCLIYSPTITAGVSYEGNRFDVMVSYLVNSHYTPSIDISIQQMYRVRNLNDGDMYVYLYDLNMGENRIPTTERDVSEYLETHNSIMNSFIQNGISFSYTGIDVRGDRLEYDNTKLGYEILRGIFMSKNRSYAYYGKILEDTLTEDYRIPVIEKDIRGILEEERGIFEKLREQDDREMPEYSEELIIDEDTYRLLECKESLTDLERVQHRVFYTGRVILGIAEDITEEIYNKYIKPKDSKDICYKCIRLKRVKDNTFSELCEKYKKHIDVMIVPGNTDSTLNVYNQRRKLYYEKILTGYSIMNTILGEGWKKDIGGVRIAYDNDITEKFNNMFDRLDTKQRAELCDIYGLTEGMSVFHRIKKILSDSYGIGMKRGSSNNNRASYNTIVIIMTKYNDIIDKTSRWVSQI